MNNEHKSPLIDKLVKQSWEARPLPTTYPQVINEADSVRFWAHVDQSQGDCWLWAGLLDLTDHGLFEPSNIGRMVPADEFYLKMFTK